MESDTYVVTVVWDLSVDEEATSFIRLSADRVETDPGAGLGIVRFFLHRSLVLEVPLAHYRGHRIGQ